MGKKLDALLGRSFRVTKLKALLNLAISRLAIFKNQRHVRYSQAKSDVTQLLQLGHHGSALLRVDQVIKELNMFDVFLLVEGYCALLLDRLHLIQQHRECPDELREAICSLFFAASRIGEFPELQEVRSALSSRFGRELASRSIELRSNCAVNPKMVQKLSTRQPDLDARIKMLKEIAGENNIILKLDEASSSTKEMSAHADASSKSDLPSGEDDYGLSDSIKTKKKYKDVADAAQAAFESAAYAAAAARAAVVLSQQSDSRDSDGHDHPGNIQKKRSFQGIEDDKSESEHEPDAKNIDRAESSNQDDVKAASKRLMSDSSTDSEEIITEVGSISFTEDPVKLLEKDVVIWDSEEESQHSTKATSKVGDKVDLMGGKNKAVAKGPVSVRTRQVRGY